MKRILIGTAGLLSLASVAVAAEGTPTTWFDETLQAFRLSSKGDGEWITSAGRWMPQAGDRSSCSNAEQKVYVNTCGSELTYRPCQLNDQGKPTTTTLTSAYNTLTKFTINDAVFTAFRGGDEWSYVDSIPLGGLSLRKHDAGDCTFIGWVTTRDSSCVKGRWIELSAAGVEAQEKIPYTVVVETDFRTIPNRLRYTVNGQALKDVKGNEWFSIRKSSLDPASSPKARAEKLCFNGNGSVGPIVAETTAVPAARGTVTVPFSLVSRPKPGATVDASQFLTDGPALGANVTYQWYLIDASGRKVPGSDLGTASAYTLGDAEYGHWVAVDIADENGFFGTGKFWYSNLPVVYIECKDAKGWVETEDETAVEGRTYYWADEEDRFSPIATTVGEDLATYRAQYGKLFLENVQTAWPTSKKEDHKAKIYISGNKDWKVQYDKDGTVEDGEEIQSKIHVRGNSTAGADKKPYKIKLGKKADPFGLSLGVKNKHWTLLANCFDESLMRNKLCYDYSGMLGLVAMRSEWVDVVMNGKFVGNYQLCEHIRVAEERINIYDWSSAYEKIAAAAQEANPDLTDDDVGDIETQLEEHQEWMGNGKFSYKGVNYSVAAKGAAGPDGQGGFNVIWKKYTNDITGGYIFELDWKKAGSSATALAPSAFVQNHSGKGSYQFCLSMNTPEFCFTNPDVSNYVWNCWNDIGQSWSSGTGYNKKGQHYSEICDFDSMVNYWLAIHVPGNNDAGGLSRYAYKDQGGKVVFGPAWDYDYGLDSLQIRTRRASVTNEYGEATYAPIVATGWIPGAGSQNFMGGWTWDPYFMYKLREKYLATRQYLTDMVKDGGLIDSYIEYLGPSARANDLRWNNRIGFFGNAEETGDAYVVKQFLTQRFAWLDQQFETNLGKALPKLTQTATSSGRYSRSTAIAPTVTGATTVPGSPETDLADVELVVKSAPVTVSVAVPTANAAKLEVYVNGLSYGTFNLSSAKATVALPAELLKPGEKNFIEFRAEKADGAFLASNVALVKANLPTALDEGSGDGQAPAPVTISWIDEAYEKLVDAEAVDPADAPKTYADYVTFVKAASPIGKATVPWQDFVADTNPADSNDVFKASITIGADGLPKVSWKPDRSDKGGAVVRGYTLRGANDLATDPKNWDSLKVDGDEDAESKEFRRSHNFFKVEVSMP